MSSSDWRAELARARRFARRLQASDPGAPTPPAALPPGRVVELPGRGEVFVRETQSPRQAAPEGVSAPTILLLHGWTASADLNWFRVYDALAPYGRVIAIDHRGHGRGMRTPQPFTLEDAADDAAALLRVLADIPRTEPGSPRTEPSPTVVIGYSMGGPISMLLWQRHAELVDGLVLQATALEWRGSRRERVVWRFMAGLEFFLRLGKRRGLVERALRDAAETSPDLAPLTPWLKGELRRADPEALADAGRALGNYDARPFAATIDVPTVVVVTTKDRLVRPRKQRQLARAIPGATTIELAGDHDAALVLAEPFRHATVAALSDVLGRIETDPQRRAPGFSDNTTFSDNATRVAGWGV